ncbi:hypothetical protein GE061_015156 [Apolygus lucorum]|uniref:Uncharacterized protein n=1 Tax=Apolygus lucorum TaxID=248454 RepID=A0A8S9XLA9_APOLU|nr:hypothetical protein GE061_015156 [Apolygus lucorum]
MDVSRNEQPQSKDVENKSGVPKGETSFGDTHSVRKQSQTNDAKPSMPNTTESKPAPDAQQKKNNSKLAVENSSSRDHLQEGTSSSKQPDANQTHADNHCICCKCKQNKENADNAALFLNPCYCNSQDSKGSRPIFQFFANPIPCDCQQKSGVQAPKSQLQEQKRDSQDAGTQTGKKPTPCRSADQVAPTQSEHENAPCILSSESCTCTVSRTSSRNKKDPENNQPEKSKSNTNCTCPQDIEEVFQNFDDSYSKCVQEIKVLIREGHLRRYNGSDESFTVTREITVVPSKSKSGEDKPKEAPRQHLEFRESQDKIKSEDSYAAPKSPNKPPTQTPTDLRSDIEELKRLIKDTRFGHCPCCKCCKCEKEVKVSDESSKPHDEQDKSRPEPSLAQGQPDSKHDERKLSTSLPPAEYFDKMVDPKGASIAKDEQGKHKVEASPVSGEKPTGKSTKGMNEATKNSNRNVPTKDQKPDQSFKSLNERPGSIPKDDPRILPKNTSSKEIVEPKKEPAESSKTKDESPEYQSERDQEIKDTNNEPPEGSKIIHISPSYIDPEGLPAVVKELIAKEPAKDLEPGSKLDSNKQEVRKSQDQDQQEQKQFLSASRSLTSSSNKNFETKQEGGKVGSRSFTSDDSKNRKPKQGGESLGRISDEKIESKENLHRQPKARSGLQPSTLDQNNEPKTREGQEMGEGTGDISTPIIDSASGPVTTPRGTKVSVGGGKVVIEVPIGPKNAEPLEKKESRITTVSDKGPSLEAEGEYGGEKQGPERKPETTAGKRKLDNELDEKKKSKAEMENESEIGSNRPKPRRVETTDKNLEPASSAADKKKFMSGNEGDKQRKLSLERQALDESRDRFFSEKRADNEGFARRGDEDGGKSWSPFAGVFGSGREKGSGISEKRSKTDAGSQSSKTGARIDDSGSNVLQKPDGDEVSIESEASSTTVTDDCDDLFNSQPCTFYSEESGVSSITEAIKATETELYVMIIESQPPLVQSHDRHDEIISLLLSDNNVSDFSGNSDLGNGSTSKTSIPNSQQSSLPTKPHCARTAPHNGREKQSCFPVELITLQTSDESVLLDTDIGSSAVVESNSSNEQPLPLERATSSSLHIINKVMKERKIGGSKEERDSRRRSCSVRKRADKKKVHYSNIPNRIHDEMTGSRESARPVEELDLAENVKNQEVQVTKWNCKVQTAGPRKFNLTDIPREMEDKLAKYLGLERTVEVMDLKEKTFKDEKSPTPRENSNLKESKRSFQKNRQTAKLLSAKGK